MCAMELVLVIDHERRTRRQVCDDLEMADFRVLTASDLDEGMNMIRRENPDLLVLEAGISYDAGRNLTQQIRLEPSLASIPILMMTPSGHGRPLAEGFNLVADDYVSKPFNPLELVRRVRALLKWKKGQLDHPLRIYHADLVLDLAGRELMVRDELVELSPTQFDLLALLMGKPGHVFTRQELLEATLGYSDEGSGRTLDTHIRNIRQKIEIDPHFPKYIRTIVGTGYCFTR